MLSGETSVPSPSMTRTAGSLAAVPDDRSGRNTSAGMWATSCNGSPARRHVTRRARSFSPDSRITVRNTRSSAVRNSRDSACAGVAPKAGTPTSILIGDGDFLDRGGRHDGAAHRRGIGVGAAFQAGLPDGGQRRDGLADAPFRPRHRALRREANFFRCLAFDIGIEAAMDHRHRHTGNQRPGDNRHILVQPAGDHGILVGLP